MIKSILCWLSGGHDVACFPCGEPALTYCLKCDVLWDEGGNIISQKEP